MVMSRRDAILGMSLRLLIVGIAIIFALFPVLFIILSAFNPTGQLSSGLALPRVDNIGELFNNFRALMIDELDIWPFWRWIGNSFVVASVSTALTVLISALAAYSFSRFRFYGRRTLLLNACRLYEEGHHSQLILLAMEDITQRKEWERKLIQQSQKIMISEEALRKQTHILESILSSTGDGVVVADDKGRFLLFNPAAEKLLGVVPREANQTMPSEWAARNRCRSPRGCGAAAAWAGCRRHGPRAAAPSLAGRLSARSRAPRQRRPCWASLPCPRARNRPAPADARA